MKANIDIEDFRVPPGGNVKLKEWPTLVDPFYESDKRYHKLLKEQVDELSSLQRMHYMIGRIDEAKEKAKSEKEFWSKSDTML